MAEVQTTTRKAGRGSKVQKPGTKERVDRRDDIVNDSFVEAKRYVKSLRAQGGGE